MATCTTNADGTRCWGRVLLVVAEAMLKARERGWDRTAEELAEMLADPEGLAALLDELETDPETAGRAWEAYRATGGRIVQYAADSPVVQYGWSPDQTRTGGLKAVGSGEHAGRVLYGERARQALNARARHHAADDPTRARRSGNPEEGHAAAAKATNDPASLTPADLHNLVAHMRTLADDQRRALARQVRAHPRLSGVDRSKVEALHAYAVGGRTGALEAHPQVKPRPRSKATAAAGRYRNHARRRRVIRAVRNEAELANAVGGFNLPDSEPADVVYLLDAAGRPVTTHQGIRDALRHRETAVKLLRGKAAGSEQRAAAEAVLGQPAEFFEVKTLLTSKSGKARMSRQAIARKERWMDRYGVAFSTVLVDDRRGAKHSGHRVYVAPGELGGTVDPAHMTRADDMAAVLRHVRGSPS